MASLAVVVVLLARGARADEPPPVDAANPPPPVPPDHGLSLGVRTGYGIPAANIDGRDSQGNGNRRMTELFSGMVPLSFDVGYRVRPSVILGGYFQYGFALPGSACPTGGTCPGSVIRLGVEAHWHFLPRKPADPWIGLGAGYEIAAFHGKQADVTVDQTFEGFELVNVEMGLDFKATPSLRVGPFLTGTYGQYLNGKSVSSDGSTDFCCRIDNHAEHLWFVLGIRSQYDL